MVLEQKTGYLVLVLERSVISLIGSNLNFLIKNARGRIQKSINLKPFHLARKRA